MARDWRLFIAATFLFGFGFAIYNGVFQNFIREVLHAGPKQLGMVESLREVPGLLTALLAGTLVALAESRVAAVGLAIAGIGIAATGVVRTVPSLVLISVFWSIGFHVFSTVQSAITLALAKGREGGRHLGKMAAVGASSTIAGLGTALLVRSLFPELPYPAYFFAAGSLILGAGCLFLALSHHASGLPRQPIVFRREYSLYYLLTFLEGCRRQVFSTFATFTLIAVYKTPLAPMLALQFVNAILISLTAPRIGRIVDRLGERKPLMAYAIALLLVFVGYATIRLPGVLYALYLIDNVLFSFSVGFTTYLHRIVLPADLTPSLAMGTTMNHIAAVVVPIGGAWLWEFTDNYQMPFWVGAAVALVSLWSTNRLPDGPPPSAAKHEETGGPTTA
ncbi:MAG: MFS transporter [Fimbriimonadales bacterium]